MGGGKSRREFLTKALYGATAVPLAARLSRLGLAAAALEFRGPERGRGTFVPFYEVGAGTPYEMDFDLT